MSVLAVVVTYNRKDWLLECLDALAAQTHPVDRVILVDNASTDGTEDAVAASGLPDRLELSYVRLRRNGGGSEGFHYGVREALRHDCEWIWLMDDDCEPRRDSLERLLAAPSATQAGVAALVPAVELPGGEPLPMHRGWIVRRPVRAPVSALAPGEYERAEAECDFSSFVGPLFRSSALRAIGAPLRESFIRFDDLEYSARLRAHGGGMRLVGSARIVHKEAIPVTGTDMRTLLRDFAVRGAFKDQWKGVYGLRNVVDAGHRYGFVGSLEALSYVAVQAVRIALFDERKLRTVRLYATYAYDGWRGLFRNVAPAAWAPLATARDPIGYLNERSLRYDADVAEPARPVRAPAAPPTAAA